MMNFPTRIKELRIERKLTQEQLGDKINVTKVSISGYESGNRKPDIETLQKLAEHFDVNVDYLLGNTAVKGRQPASYVQQMGRLTRDGILDAAEKAKQGDGIKEQTAAYNPLDDPELNLFFKDFASAPEQMKKEMLEFWEFVKHKEKDRKPGDKQGE